MNKNGMAVMIVIVMAVSACATNEVSRSSSLCEVDVKTSVEMERLSFRLPSFWGRLTPCGAVYVYHNFWRGDWKIVARGADIYKDVVALNSAISMNINTDMWFLGMNREQSPEEWYKKESRNGGTTFTNGHPTERQFTWVIKQGMGCWREDSRTYLIKYKNKKRTRELYSGGLSYTCWPESQRTYPAIWLGASMSYRNGKPVYPDIDLEKDILDPVFATLTINELSEEQYNQRVQKNREAQRKRCEEGYHRYVDRLATKSGNVTNASMNNMLDCGYNDAKQRRCDALAKHSDELKQNYILAHRKLGYNMERLEETLHVCDYSEEAIAVYKQSLCSNSLAWFRKRLTYKKYRPYTWVVDHLKQCGYESDPVYQEGKQRAIREGARIIKKD